MINLYLYVGNDASFVGYCRKGSDSDTSRVQFHLTPELSFRDVLALHLGTKQLRTRAGTDMSRDYVNWLLDRERGKYAEGFYTYALTRNGEWSDVSPWDDEAKTPAPELWTHRWMDAWYFNGDRGPGVHWIVWRSREEVIMECAGEIHVTSRRAPTRAELLTLPDDALSPVARRLRHDLRVIVRQPPRPLGSAVIEDTIRDHADLHFAIATIAGKINPKKEIGDLQAWARSVKQQLQQLGELRQAITSATRAFDEDNTIALAHGPAEVQGLIDTVFKWRNRSTRRAAPREESG